MTRILHTAYARERDEPIVAESLVPDDAADTVPGSMRPIGAILAELRGLDEAQIDRIVALQQHRGMRFGEAAVALGLARGDEVLWALSQQFGYPYSPASKQRLSPELVVAIEPFGARAEAFRAVRSQLTMRLGDQGGPRRALAVVSPDSGDGKTYFAANIAVALSQIGGRTLLVDADLRHPRQHRVFGVDNSRGLSSILSGRSSGNPLHTVPQLPSLSVLPVGPTPPNPLELLERPACAMLLRELLERFEHVVVDTTAAVHGSDAVVMAAKCGAALALARQGRSRIDALQTLVGQLGQTRAEVAGVVMNEY
ncbi:MAG: polysaccharide biosynthesis tyrosine autokinase [Piscinibacter sp.]|nr:polysaccharide biosynthesis tyrosine autokinase [Piscinibacter sp.]